MTSIFLKVSYIPIVEVCEKKHFFPNNEWWYRYFLKVSMAHSSPLKLTKKSRVHSIHECNKSPEFRSVMFWNATNTTREYILDGIKKSYDEEGSLFGICQQCEIDEVYQRGKSPRSLGVVRAKKCKESLTREYKRLFFLFLSSLFHYFLLLSSSLES